MFSNHTSYKKTSSSSAKYRSHRSHSISVERTKLSRHKSLSIDQEQTEPDFPAKFEIENGTKLPSSSTDLQNEVRSTKDNINGEKSCRSKQEATKDGRSSHKAALKAYSNADNNGTSEAEHLQNPGTHTRSSSRSPRHYEQRTQMSDIQVGYLEHKFFYISQNKVIITSVFTVN